MSRTYRHCLEYKKGLIPPRTEIFRVIDGEGEGYPDVFVDRLGDRILVSTRDCAVPVNLGKELAELDVPVFHKRLEQNQKEAPVQIAGPILPCNLRQRNRACCSGWTCPRVIPREFFWTSAITVAGCGNGAGRA